jgi:hypothetical protein
MSQKVMLFLVRTTLNEGREVVAGNKASHDLSREPYLTA